MHGRNKIQDAWDSSPYKAVDTPADYLGSVYSVKPVNNPGQTQKVHRSSFKSPSNPSKEQKDPRPKPVSKPTSSDPKNAVNDEGVSDEKLVLILTTECTKPIPVPTGEPETKDQTSAEPIILFYPEETYYPK